MVDIKFFHTRLGKALASLVNKAANSKAGAWVIRRLFRLKGDGSQDGPFD